MTAAAAKAREAALSFEAKKTGFGQAQDGWSLTLRIQDIDVPDSVAKAKKGTRFMVVLVEIGDDEQPVSQRDNVATPAVTPRSVSTPEPTGDEIKSKKSAAQIAGYLCTLPLFWKFLEEKFSDDWHRNGAGSGITKEQIAKECIYDICTVTSRTQLTDKNIEWNALRIAFQLWENHPELEDA